jgi:hypothetical protein
MADLLDHQQLLAEVRQGQVSGLFYQLFCAHCRRSAEALQEFAGSLGLPLTGSLKSLARGATAPLSRAELQRTLEKMSVPEREQFAAEILNLGPDQLTDSD